MLLLLHGWLIWIYFFYLSEAGSYFASFLLTKFLNFDKQIPALLMSTLLFSTCRLRFMWCLHFNCIIIVFFTICKTVFLQNSQFITRTSASPHIQINITHKTHENKIRTCAHSHLCRGSRVREWRVRTRWLKLLRPLRGEPRSTCSLSILRSLAVKRKIGKFWNFEISLEVIQ